MQPERRRLGDQKRCLLLQRIAGERQQGREVGPAEQGKLKAGTEAAASELCRDLGDLGGERIGVVDPLERSGVRQLRRGREQERECAQPSLLAAEGGQRARVFLEVAKPG